MRGVWFLDEKQTSEPARGSGERPLALVQTRACNTGRE